MNRPAWLSVSAEHRTVLVGYGRRALPYLRGLSSVIGPCAARGRRLIRHMGEASLALEQCVARSRALVSRLDGGLMRAVVAFTVSFVVVMTVGMLVLPERPPRLRSKPPADPVPAMPTFTLTSRLPSHWVPPKDTPSRYYEDAANLSAEIKPNAGQESKAGAGSKTPNGPRQTAAVATRPSADVRGGVVRVTGIALWGTPDRPWVSITASGPVRYQLRHVDPDWVVVDISRAQLAVSSDLPAGRGPVKQIRTGQFAPDVVRVVVELTGPISVHIATSLDKTAIVVSLAAQARGNGRVPSSPEQQIDRGPAPGFPHSAIGPAPASARSE
jgi:AMIN domain